MKDTSKAAHSTSKILPCVCKHDFQDKRYKGKRVMALCTKETRENIAVYKCTVCSKAHRVQG